MHGVEPQSVVTAPLRFEHWGRLAYAPAFEKQQASNLAVREGAAPMVAFVEHDPVITVSRRPKAEEHLIATPEHLQALGIEVQPTDRGGDITYHGPGQLVAYPFIRIKDLGLGLVEYMRWLEDVVIDTLASFGITGQRVCDCTGVWIQGESDGQDEAERAKICAMGVRVRRGVTMHGLALNVSTDLSHFQTIVPCGLTKPVTSMQQILGEACPSMEAVMQSMTQAFEKAITQRT